MKKTVRIFGILILLMSVAWGVKWFSDAKNMRL